MNFLQKWSKSRYEKASRAENARDAFEKETQTQMMGKQLRAVESLASQFLACFCVFLLIYAAAALSVDAAASKGRPSGFSGFVFIIGVHAVLLSTAVIAGGFLGFLFGIPRLLQRTAGQQTPPTNATTDASQPATVTEHARLPTFAGNTNLEEISDWLTKIIVGIGLTQAVDLYDGFIEAQTEFAASTMGGAPGANAVFAATVISGVVLGFLFFYLETRTRVTILLVAASHAQNSLAPQKELEFAKRTTDPLAALLGESGDGKALRDIIGPPTESDLQIVKNSLADLNGVPELSVWGASQVRLGNFISAEQAFSKAISLQPDNPKLHLALAIVKSQSGNKKAAGDVLNAASKRFSDNPQVLRKKILNALYLDAPQSYEQALEAANALIAIAPAEADDPQVQLWIAAANGQKFRYSTDESEKTAARQDALAAVRKIIALAPARNHVVRKMLREIFDPKAEGSPLSENDLETFLDDEAFVELIKT